MYRPIVAARPPAGLVMQEKDGRIHRCRIVARPLREAACRLSKTVVDWPA